MASIRKRGGKFQAQVRCKGAGPVSATFTTKAEAQRWVRSIEIAIDDGTITPVKEKHCDVTFGEILERYEKEVTVQKKWKQREISIIKTVRRFDLWNATLSSLTEDKAAYYRNTRSNKVKPATVVRELALLAHCLEVARRDWGYPIRMNCFKLVKKPVVRNGRTRRLSDHKKIILFGKSDDCKTNFMFRLIEFSIETAIRKGEMLNIEIKHIDLKKATLEIPHTKNGHPRIIPLSPRAIEILEFETSVSRTKYVFNIKYWTLSQRWEKFRKTAQIDDLKWHDLRHEAISIFFEKGLSVPEVSLISGHRDYKLLQRYTHIKPENVAAKLARISGPTT